MDPINKDISVGKFNLKQVASIGNSESPAPTLSTTFFAKAGTWVNSLFLVEKIVAPFFPCVIAIYLH